MHWYDNHMSGWAYGLMALTTAALVALVVVGIVALVRYLDRSGGSGPAAPPAPEQILRERFARGEIDEDEYRSRLDALHTARRP